MYRLKSPLRVQMEITEACNNACSHCYNFWRYVETGARISKDDHRRDGNHFARILDMIIEMESNAVTFTGGEPFLRRDILFDLVAQAKSAGLLVHINTNGALIKEDDVSLARDLKVDHFQVSLMSYNAETHNRLAHAKSHGLTVRAIKMLVDANQPMSVNMVTSQANWNQVVPTAEMISELGVKSFSASPILSCHLSSEHGALMLTSDQLKQTMHDLLWVHKHLDLGVYVLEPLVFCAFDAEEREQLSSILGSRYCCAGISDCAISPDGDMRPCILSTETGGNILEDGWITCWRNLANWKDPKMLPSDCLTCSRVDLCGGGCREAALSSTGRLNGKDPYMTEPISVDSETHCQPTGQVELGDDQILMSNPDLFYRQEEFGGTITVGQRCSFLTPSVYEFFIVLIKDQAFSARSTATKYGLDLVETNSFLRSLLNNGFLLTMGEGGGQ